MQFLREKYILLLELTKKMAKKIEKREQAQSQQSFWLKMYYKYFSVLHKINLQEDQDQPKRKKSTEGILEENQEDDLKKKDQENADIQDIKIELDENAPKKKSILKMKSDLDIKQEQNAEKKNRSLSIQFKEDNDENIKISRFKMVPEGSFENDQKEEQKDEPLRIEDNKHNENDQKNILLDDSNSSKENKKTSVESSDQHENKNDQLHRKSSNESLKKEQPTEKKELSTKSSNLSDEHQQGKIKKSSESDTDQHPTNGEQSEIKKKIQKKIQKPSTLQNQTQSQTEIDDEMEFKESSEEEERVKVQIKVKTKLDISRKFNRLSKKIQSSQAALSNKQEQKKKQQNKANINLIMKNQNKTLGNKSMMVDQRSSHHDHQGDISYLQKKHASQLRFSRKMSIKQSRQPSVTKKQESDESFMNRLSFLNETFQDKSQMTDKTKGDQTNLSQTYISQEQDQEQEQMDQDQLLKKYQSQWIEQYHESQPLYQQKIDIQDFEYYTFNRQNHANILILRFIEEMKQAKDEKVQQIPLEQNYKLHHKVTFIPFLQYIQKRFQSLRFYEFLFRPYHSVYRIQRAYLFIIEFYLIILIYFYVGMSETFRETGLFLNTKYFNILLVLVPFAIFYQMVEWTYLYFNNFTHLKKFSILIPIFVSLVAFQKIIQEIVLYKRYSIEIQRIIIDEIITIYIVFNLMSFVAKVILKPLLRFIQKKLCTKKTILEQFEKLELQLKIFYDNFSW